MNDRPEPKWVERKVVVNGSRVKITLDLAWTAVPSKKRPKHMYDFGHDLLPFNVWDGFWARRSCKAVEKFARKGLNGTILVGKNDGLGECGVLVAMRQTGPLREIDAVMTRAWPMRGSAYAMSWGRYDRLLSMLGE